MSGSVLENLRPEDVEAAVKEEERTPGGMKMNIILSPALSKSAPRSNSHTSSPHTQAEIDEKMAAVASRREKLDKLRVKNISEQLAKVDDAKQRREEINAEKSSKSKEVLETRMEALERNRATQLQLLRMKQTEQLAKVERAHQELEIQTEAARVAASCSLKAKLSKTQENREEQLEELIKRLKEHEKHVAEVRLSHERLFSEDKNKVEAELTKKLEKAAKERERQEQELLNKLEEKNKHAEIVRMNKEKLQAENTTVPESA